ncbi:MAG: ABC transporter permease [Deltaproteobacteria bacterium]
MRKELRQTFRDKRMFAVLFIAPVLQLTLLGFAVDLDVDRVPAAIVDDDRSDASRDFVSALFADGTLVPAPETDGPGHPLEEGTASVVVVLPRGFADDLAHGRTVDVQALVDGTDPIRAQAAIAHVTQLAQQRGITAIRTRMEAAAGLRGAAPTLPTITIEPRVLYNPSLESPVYMVPGVAAMVLLIVTTVITAMSIAREKELGTIEQLLVTPMRPLVLLLGKVLPFGAIGLVAAGVVISVGTHVFDVPVRGSLLALGLGTVLYLMSTLGTGVFISTMAKNQQQAILGGFFFIMPAILLSGFMSPVENMPDWIQAISSVNPVRYYVQILRAVLLKGATIADLWFPMIALGLFGASILGLSANRFRKRLA